MQLVIDNGSFFSASDLIFGRSYSHWTDVWWASYYYNDIDRNALPVFMVPGRMVDLGESITYRAFSFTSRPILVPIVNWYSDGREQSARQEAKMRMDLVDTGGFNATIDGEQVRHYVCRITSDNLQLEGKLREVSADVSGQAVSDGYWLFIKGLPVGTHHVHTFGTCTKGVTRLDMNYDLTVI